MKKILFTCCTLVFFTLGLKAQVPQAFADELQAILDAAQMESEAEGYSGGLSAAVNIKGVGIWTGTTGYSHDSVALDPSMIMAIGSNTKLFTSVLCLKMQENGLLSLDDSLHTWLPSYPNIDSTATLRQLLRHQSGFYNYTNNDDVWTALYANPTAVWTYEQILELVEAPSFAPGEDIEYSNTNYMLASMILEEVTGIDYPTLVRDSILTVLDIQDTYLDGYETVEGTRAHPWSEGVDYNYIPRIAFGTLSNGAGCIASTPTEMVKWYDKLFTTDFLSAASMAEMMDYIDWGNLDLGLGIFHAEYNGNEYIFHGGTTPGFSSDIVHNLACGNSASVIANDGDNATNGYSVLLLEKACMLSVNTNDVQELDNSISVFPNPAYEVINISSKNTEDVINTISIMDVTGRVVYQNTQVNSPIHQVNSSEFTNQVYYLQLTLNGGKTTATKLITIQK